MFSHDEYFNESILLPNEEYQNGMTYSINSDQTTHMGSLIPGGGVGELSFALLRRLSPSICCFLLNIRHIYIIPLEILAYPKRYSHSVH